MPVVFFWFPYQVVRDVLRVRSHHRDAGSLVGWWWAAWLGALVVVNVETILVPYDEIDTSVVSAFGAASTATALLTVVACVLWVRVLRRIADDQQALLSGSGHRA